MTIGTFIPALLLLTSVFHGTMISGRLTGSTDAAIGGPDAYMVAFVQSLQDIDKIDILGYTHPDEQGNWIISNLPASGKIHLLGFHLKLRASLFCQEVSMDGSPAMDLGVQQATDRSIGMGPLPGLSQTESHLPHLLMGKQNQDIADAVLKFALAEKPAAPSAANDSKGIEGNWMRSGRIYRISGGKATVVDAGTTLKTSVTAGDEVMRNITKSGENTWSAEVLWQMESEKKWAAGMLTLSPDGNTLTRLSISPWAGSPEVVVFLRKTN